MDFYHAMVVSKVDDCYFKILSLRRGTLGDLDAGIESIEVIEVP